MRNFEGGGNGDGGNKGKVIEVKFGKEAEGEARHLDAGIIAAREKVEALGGKEALMQRITSASGEVKESLVKLLAGTPAAFVAFAAIGIIPAEMGSILSEYTMASAGLGGGIDLLRASEFAVMGSAELGAIGAGLVALLAGGGLATDLLERIKLGQLRQAAKV